MKDLLAGVVSMLETGGPEQQVAAAQVLAWLKPKTPAVVKALGAAAGSGGSFLRPYAVDALAAIGSPTAVATLIPLLHVEGPLRDTVARSFAKLGGEAEKVLVREFDRADEDTKAVILEILAQTRGTEAMKTIFAVFKDPESGELSRQAARHLLAEVQGLRDSDEAQREKLRRIFLQNLKRLPKKAPVSYRVHLLELLVHVGDASCRSVFFSATGASQPAEVRAAGLRGLAGLELTPAQTSKLLSYLAEPDFVNVVGPSLAVLASYVPSGAQAAAALGKLLAHDRPEVRLFAMKGLGHYQTPTAAKLLLPCVENADRKVRALASEGLGRNPEARAGLLKMLLDARDLEEAERPIDALTQLAPKLTQPQIKKLVARFLKLVEAEDPVRDLYQRVLANATPNLVAPLLLDEAKRLRGQRRFDAAMRVLQTLTSGSDGEMNPDVRYELAVTMLLRRGADPDYAGGDPVVGHFCHLIRDGFQLLTKVKRERSLQTSHLLYLGQRFVERLNDERRFGSELLGWLIKKEPEAKESVQAMQKLKVEGLA